MFWGIINHDCALDSNLFVVALHYCAFNLLCENFDLGRFQSETRQQQQLPFILHGSHRITQWPALHPAVTFLTWSNSSSSSRRLGLKNCSFTVLYPHNALSLFSGQKCHAGKIAWWQHVSDTWTFFHTDILTCYNRVKQGCIMVTASIQQQSGF